MKPASSSKGWLFIILASGLSLGACAKTLHLANTTDQSYPVNAESAEEDPDIRELIAPYKAELDAEMQTVIGQCSGTLFKQRPESTLGNWFADALLAESRNRSGRPVDIAIQNYGGIRIGSLAEGPVTVGQIYELMPFENNIVILDLRGDTLKLFLDHIAASNGWPVSHTLQMEIRNQSATHVNIHGRPLDLTARYLVALPDYIANGGDRCTYLVDQRRIELNYLVRDAILTFIRDLDRQGKTISAKLENRITALD